MCGEPIIVPEDSTDEGLEEKRVLLENVLNELTEKADNYFA
ncbi:MAG: hypothetical protein V3W26_05250 [Thermodesulfobacteriota bacterium]